MVDPVRLIDAKSLVDQWEHIGGMFRIERAPSGEVTGALPVLHPMTFNDPHVQQLAKRLLRPQIRDKLLQYLQERSAGSVD